MNPVIIALIAYLAVINIIAFIMFGVDKKRAANSQWRISEKALFLSAILGGGIGALCGMYHFRHKTKHWYFVVFIPVILVADYTALALLVFKYF